MQGALERALGVALQEDRDTLRMTAAARTDAGVHAVGQARPLNWSGSPTLVGFAGPALFSMRACMPGKARPES